MENLQRPLRSVGYLEGAVEEAVAALDLKPEDCAAVELGRHYAEQIDHAERMAAVADRAIRTLMKDDPDEEDHQKYVYALAAKVEAKELLDKLGPKLLAILEAVGATPAARAKLKGGGPVATGPSQLDRLRQTRGKSA